MTVAARSWAQVTCRSQPIRDEYYCVSTNLRSVLLGVNQSEMSIVLYQPIREQYCFVSTNQRTVLVCINQSEASIYLQEQCQGAGSDSEHRDTTSGTSGSTPASHSPLMPGVLETMLLGCFMFGSIDE